MKTKILTFLLNLLAVMAMAQQFEGSHIKGKISCSFSPDGKTMLSIGVDRVIKVWDIESCSLKHKFYEKSGLIHDLYSFINLHNTFSQDGRYFFINDYLYNLSEGTGIKIDKKLFSFSPDNNYYTIATPNPSYEFKVQKCPSTSQPNSTNLEEVFNVRFKTDYYRLYFEYQTGKLMIFIDNERRILFYNFKQDAPFFEISTPKEARIHLSFDKKLLFIDSYKGAYEIWDLSGEKPVKPKELNNTKIMDEYRSTESDHRISATNIFKQKLFTNNPEIEIWDIQKNTKTSIKISVEGKVFNQFDPFNHRYSWIDDSGDLSKIMVNDAKTGKTYGPLIDPTINQDIKKLIASSSKELVDKYFSWYDAGQSKSLTASAINSVKFSPDGERVVATSDDKQVRIYNTKTKQVEKTLSGHTDRVSAASISPDGKLLATGSDDESVRIWSWPDGNFIKSIGLPAATGMISFGAKNVRVWDVALIPNTSLVLYSGNAMLMSRYHIQLWDREKGTKEHTFEGHTANVRNIKVIPNSTQFISVACDGMAKLWDYQKKQFVKDIASGLGELWCVDVSPDGKMVAVSGAERTVWVFDIESGKKLFEFGGHFQGVTQVKFLPDGKKLISAGYDKKAIVWDLDKQLAVHRFTDFDSPIFALDVLSNGQKIAFGTEKGLLKIENIDIEEQKSDFDSNSPLQPRIISHVSTPFVNASKPPLLVFDKGMHTAEVSQVKYHPNGKEIVTASWDKSIRILDAKNGAMLRTIRVPSGIGLEGQLFAMDISPDGNYIVAAGSSLGIQNNKKTVDFIGHYVLLIDYKTGRILDVAAKHNQSIFGLAFSPDGNYIASGGGTADNKVVLYRMNKTARKLEFVNEQSVADLSLKYYPTCNENPKSVGGVCSQMVTRVAFLPNSIEAISVDELGMVFSHSDNLKNSKLIGESALRKMSAFMGKLSGREMIRSLAVDPLGRFIATGDLGGITTFLDPKGTPSANSSNSFEKNMGNIPSFNNRAVFALAISSKGDRIAVASHNKVNVYDLKVADGKVQSTLLTEFKKHNDGVLGLAFNPSGTQIVSTGESPSESYCWNAANGEVLFALSSERKADVISAVGVHKSNPLLIGFGKNLNKTLNVNANGQITHAFDLTSLSLIKNVKESDFVTATDRVKKFSTPKPELKFLMATENVYSYMPLDKNNVIIGGTYNLYLNAMGSPIFNAGSTVTGLAMCPDEKTFYAAYQNGTIQIYDVDAFKLIATLYISENNEWIIWTPDGYYAASKYGAQSVAWLFVNGATKSPDYYPFEQFDLRLNRPDIVLSRIGGMSKELISGLNYAYKKRLRKMGIDESKLTADMATPTITIDLDSKDIPSKTVTFNVTAESPTAPMKMIMVYVNDVPIYGAKGLVVAANKKVTQPITLPLSNGRNKIQVSAINQQGVESLKETRYLNYTGAISKPDLYIVTIGVSDYKDNTYDLTYAAKDANDIVNLYNSKSSDYAKVNVLTFNDTKAIKEDIAGAKQLLKGSKVDDMVIVFVAAHGLRDDKSNYYIATHDTDFENPSARGLGYDQLESLIDDIPARKKLLLIDACNSGELDEDVVASSTASIGGGTVASRGFKSKAAMEQAKLAKPMGVSQSNDLFKELFNDLRRGTGAMVISSAGGAEFAFESSEWKNGVFTYSLLEGIRTGKADANKDGEIRVSELRDYVFARVKELTQGKQNPTSRQENLEFDFRVW
jgi:WD40 repeat protein